MEKKRENDQPEKKGAVIPAGSEQETGLTRGRTEAEKGPVKSFAYYYRRRDNDESVIRRN